MQFIVIKLYNPIVHCNMLYLNSLLAVVLLILTVIVYTYLYT